MRPREFQRRLNSWAAGLLLLATLATTAGLGALVYVRRQAGPEMFAYARLLHSAGQKDLALRYLQKYNRWVRNDLNSKMLAGDWLVERAWSWDDLQSAAALYEQALRRVPNKRSAMAQRARRQLVRLYLSLGPREHRLQTKYQTADLLASDLLAVGGRTPESLRLRGWVKRQLALDGDQTAMAQAIELFEEARQKEPGEIEGALTLAATYRDHRRDLPHALAVLDELVAANPSAAAGLARFRFLDESARQFRARSDLENAEILEAEAEGALRELLADAPDEPEVCLSACEHAMVRGRLGEARAAIDSIPERARGTSRYQVVLGVLLMREGRLDEALATWREALLAADGTDPELTWWLAYAELERGRPDEADPLIDQYRRLRGEEPPPPAWDFLDGLRSLARNRPIEAIRTLNLARLKAPEDLQPSIHLALARAHRSTRAAATALEHYREALRFDPYSKSARIGYAEMLRSLRPGDAEQAIREGLEKFEDEPELLLTLATSEWQRQRALPAAQRDWSKLERLAARAAPGHPSTAILQARLELETNHAEEAAARMERAVKSDPSMSLLWLTYAEALVRSGRLDDAVAALDQARNEPGAGDDAALRVGQARLLDALGRSLEARAALVERQEAMRPEDRATCWMALGDLEMARNRWSEATQAYRMGVALGPDDPLSRLIVLELALSGPEGEKGSAELASESVEALERIEGKDGPRAQLARALVALSRAACAEGEARDRLLADAEDELSQVRDRILDPWQADVLQGRLLELRGRPEEALAAFERANLRMDSDAIRSRLIALNVQLGRLDEASRLRRERSEAESNLERFAAESSARLGRTDEAEALAGRVVEGSPDDPDARFWQARLLNSLGKAEEAESTLRLLAERRPDRLGPKLAELRYFAAIGEHAKAEAAVERIVREAEGLERPAIVFAECWRIAGRLDLADEAFTSALKERPDDLRVAQAAASHFERTGRPARAEAVLREALAARPDWRWASLGLAALLSDRPDDLAAWREAWSLVAPDAGRTDTTEDLYIRALVLSRGSGGSHLADAAKLLEQLRRVLPKGSPAATRTRALLARVYLKEGRAEAAVEASALGADNLDDIEAVRLHVEALIACSRYDQAERALERLAASPTNRGDVALALLKARVLGASGRADEAAKAIDEVREPILDRLDGEALGREAVRLLLDLDRTEAAGRIAEALASRWPTALVVAATVEAERGKHRSALAKYREAVESADAEGFAEIARNLIALAVASKLDPEVIAGADAVLARALARQPDDPGLLIRQAHLRHLQGRYRDEVMLYRQALDQKPGDRAFLNNLAWTLCEELHAPEEALAWVREAIRSSPISARLLDTRGVILTRLGRLPEAIEDLEVATSRSSSPTMLAHLARAYHLAGQAESFRIARDRAIRAGLTTDRLEPGERAELSRLLLDKGQLAPPSR